MMQRSKQYHFGLRLTVAGALAAHEQLLTELSNENKSNSQINMITINTIDTKHTNVNSNELNSLHTEYDISAFIPSTWKKEQLDYIQAYNINNNIPLTRAQHYQNERISNKIGMTTPVQPVINQTPCASSTNR